MPPANRHERAPLLSGRLLTALGSIDGTLLPSRDVALTFDDGPDPVVTPRLLDLLRARAVRVTFFVVTEKVSRHPELVRIMAADGHEIALHADRHERLSRIPAWALRNRIRTARALLECVACRPVRFFRPPFGAQSVATYLVARSCGLDVVLWRCHAEDWIEGSPEAVAARGLRDLNAGDVLLLHDGLELPDGWPVPTFDRLRAFELILDGVATRRLNPVRIGNLVSNGQARRTLSFSP